MLLSQVLKKFNPNVIAVHSPTPHLLLYLLRCKKPIIVWIHGAEVLIRARHYYYPPFGLKNNSLKMFGMIKDVLRNIVLSQALKKVNAIICVSQWMEEMLRENLRFEHPNTFVINNPVDTDLFRPTEIRDKRPLRAISVRGLEWKYGLDVAIEAFSRSKIELLIVGKGPLETYLRCLAAKLDSNVKFFTNGVEHNKLPGIYNLMDFFVAPSRTEAQGVAMCEAMACGLPIIASFVDGIPEFVIDGKNGLLVPPNDALKLREAVRTLSGNDVLYGNLSKNARKFALDHLSPESVFKKELEVFRIFSEK